MMKKLKIKLIEELFLEIVAIAVMFFIFAAPILASEITPDKVIKLVNSARSQEGLEPLVKNETLTQIAKAKLNDMIEHSYFAHTSPSGKTPWSWFVKEKYDYQYAGENLAINFTSAEDQQKAWMKSQTHRKNILNPNYKEIGVAFGAGEIDGQMSLITVQEFGAQVALVDIPKDGKKFLMQEGKDLLEEGTRILPQVLAVKTQSPQKNNLDSQPSVKIDPAKIWPSVSEALSLVALLLFLGSLVILPISFLAVACDKIYILYETKKVCE